MGQNPRTLMAGTGIRKIELPAIGIDISFDYIKKNKEKFEYKKEEGIYFVQGDIRMLPFKEKVFDSIISIEVLEHIQEKEAIIHEFQRVSKNNAHLHLQTSTRYCEQLLGKLSKKYYFINTSNHHQNCIEGEEVKALVEKNEYFIISEEYLFSPRWFLICFFMDILQLDLNSSGNLTGKGAKLLQKIGYRLDDSLYPLFTFLNKKLHGRWNKYGKSILIEAVKRENHG